MLLWQWKGSFCCKRTIKLFSISNNYMNKLVIRHNITDRHFHSFLIVKTNLVLKQQNITNIFPIMIHIKHRCISLRRIENKYITLSNNIKSTSEHWIIHSMIEPLNCKSWRFRSNTIIYNPKTKPIIPSVICCFWFVSETMEDHGCKTTPFSVICISLTKDEVPVATYYC